MSEKALEEVIELPGHSERWKDAQTLGEALWKLYEAGQAQSEEFKQIVRYYGRDRVKKILEQEARKRRQPNGTGR